MTDQTGETRLGDALPHILGSLGREGTAVLLAVGALVLTAKSRDLRKAEIRLVRWALRTAWTGVKSAARSLGSVPNLRATREERHVMSRLAPAHWKAHAGRRGLEGTLTGRPQLTKAGIVSHVRLADTWTPAKLRSSQENVRALLGLRAGLRLSIDAGKRGGWARITVRTRSAADGIPKTWTPDHAGIGVDEVTGEPVDLPLKPGIHILVAGVTGTGKSVSWRPLVMRAHLDDEWAVVVIDPKRQEAIGWRHCLRCVGAEPNREQRMADIYGMAQELTRELHRRQGIADGQVWTPDGRPENRKLLVVIDEGAAIVRMAKNKAYADVMDLFEELWSEARSVGFQFVWATQFPTKAVGVPPAVKENMSARLSLTVNAGEAERAIFGENAQKTGWMPSVLEGVPGRAMLQYGTRGPDPLRLWHVTDEAVSSVPDAEPWVCPEDGQSGVRPVSGDDGVHVRPMSMDKEPPSAAVEDIPDDLVSAVWGLSVRDCVLSVLSESDRPMGVRQIAEKLGRSPSGVHKELGRLVEEGSVTQGLDKRYSVAGVAAASGSVL